MRPYMWLHKWRF